MNETGYSTDELALTHPMIKAKVNELKIPDNEPFKCDCLDRKKYAEVLTDVVWTVSDGAVIGLDGGWGTGKTTFVKMWMQHLKNGHFPVIYYNAWKDDFNDEPLMSLLRGLKLATNDDSKLDEVFRAGAKVMAGALFGAFKAVTGSIGTIAEGAINGGLKQLEDSCFDSLKQEDDRVALMNTLRECLKEYVASICDNKKPLVYFIDELDRCNPAFAVKVLERIKHLFDIPNVVFVLSIDQKHLECSIKGFYGSNEINAEEYLRRFIDKDFYLPEPEDYTCYCGHLFDYYCFNEFILAEERRKLNRFDEGESFIASANRLSMHKHLNLRQIERIFFSARVGMCQMRPGFGLYVELYFFLAYIQTCERELYSKICGRTLKLQDLLNRIEDVFSEEEFNKIIQPSSQDSFVYTVTAQLLACYNRGGRNGKLEVVFDNGGKNGGGFKLNCSRFYIERFSHEFSIYDDSPFTQNIDIYLKGLNLLENLNLKRRSGD